MTLNAWMKWHRWAGLAVAVFVVLLSVTGIALNHGDALGLNARFVRSAWLLDLYRIAPEQQVTAFESRGHWVSRIGERIYFNERELGERSRKLLGMVPAQDLFVIGLSERLLLVTKEGETVEILRGAEGVPAGMRRIGTTKDGRVVIEAAHGLYLPDLDQLRWEELAAVEARWPQASAPPPELAARLQEEHRAHTLTLERVMLDLHSGRIVQRLGVWFTDAVALILVSLVLSGLWIWYRR